MARIKPAKPVSISIRRKLQDDQSYMEDIKQEEYKGKDVSIVERNAVGGHYGTSESEIITRIGDTLLSKTGSESRPIIRTINKSN